jgi:prepilin-type processing-associated H-X9-DG protein
LLAKMPKVFANPYNPKLAADGKTTYLAPLHKEALFCGDNIGLKNFQITDGTSNSVMLVDVDDASAVVWTKPDDLKLDPKNPHKSLSARHGDKFLFLFADGHVEAVTKKIDKDTLWAIFTIAGGEVVQLP